MRVLLIFICFAFSQQLVSQDSFLAKQYFEEGDFKTAVVFYEKLTKANPNQLHFSQGLVSCYQQLERYSDAEIFLKNKLKKRRSNPVLYIDLGYNFTLQKDSKKAETYYNKAIEILKKQPNYGGLFGARFQKYGALNKAEETYRMAMEANPALNYHYQLARVYGEQGNIDKMYTAYLDLISKGKASKSNVLRNIDAFVSEDASSVNNIKLKKNLLIRAQKNPDILWNELLSWLFVKQKQYSSSFRQEKAIYKRMDGANITRLMYLANLVFSKKEYDLANDVYQFVIEEASDKELVLRASLKKIEINLIQEPQESLQKVDKKFNQLLSLYGYSSKSIVLQIAYANFLTFKMDTPVAAVSLLKNSLEIPLNFREVAKVKMALADVLVYAKRFNEALIYFSQVQTKLKNDVIGQNARFKVAQTSFYKGDFKWAVTQLKVLRSSATQLIANDAMQLSLLISDNTDIDSTQTALKKYARADFLSYQNKTKEAIIELQGILEDYKGQKIEDDALLKQGKLQESLLNYEAALENYNKIITYYSNGILADDAHFALAELYQEKLNKPELAKEHYQKILFNYQDSYYFPIARKQYRLLRGDILN